jgi:hypothetical protein
MSKNQQKKLRKQAAFEAKKAAKKAAEKAAKKAQQAAKWSQVQQRLANMSEVERRAWDEQKLERQQVCVHKLNTTVYIGHSSIPKCCHFPAGSQADRPGQERAPQAVKSKWAAHCH